jgi:hypothetical protein
VVILPQKGSTSNKIKQMETEYNLAERLVNSSIKNLNTEKNDLALKGLNTALELYNEFILEELNVDVSANLYFIRAVIYKHLGVGYRSNYYLDIKLSMQCGNLKATKIFNSKAFQDDNSIEKITFIFEICRNDNNEIELSSLFLKGHYHWIDKVKIVTKTTNEKSSITNFRLAFDNESLKKMRLRLLHGILFCDNFICNDLNSTKNIVADIIKNKTIDENLKSPKGTSLIEEIEKLKSFKTKNKSSNDSFNILFNKNIENHNNSEINTIITTECYGFLKYITKYASTSKSNSTVSKFLNFQQ